MSFAGGLLASGSRDRTVRLWRTGGDRLDPLLTLRVPGPVRSLAFHPDGVRLFVLLERERAVRVWHLDRLRTRLDSLGLGAALEGIEPLPLPAAASKPHPHDGAQAVAPKADRGREEARRDTLGTGLRYPGGTLP